MSAACILHMRCSPDAALPLLKTWIGSNANDDDFEMEEEKNSWTTIRMWSFSLDGCETEDWLQLGRAVDFLYESYSTSTLSGEIVHVSDQKLVRHLVFDKENKECEVDIGQLKCEQKNPLRNWADIWGFVDENTWESEVATLD
jgi:hypothetical protein